MTVGRRLLVFCAVALLSIYLGLFVLEGSSAVKLFKHVGYWTIAATFTLFVFFLYRAYGGKVTELLKRTRTRSGLIVFIAVLLGTVFLVRSEDWHFKTIMDEHVLAITSKRMHETREVEATTRALTINGAQAPLRGYVDKRPITYPFLVSLVSDLTGHRPLNGVYLNLVLTPFILLLLYSVTARMAGRLAGMGAIALFCTLPLMGNMATGGGLEPINVFFILLTLFLGGLYLQSPGIDRMGAFALSGILLAQCRYESVLFIFPVGLVILWSWLRQKQVLMPWPLYLCPVLLIPYLWHHQVFKSDYMWQMDDVKNADTPFGLEYIYDNVGRAVSFFFDFGKETPNSWLLAACGIVAILLLLVRGLRQWRSFDNLPAMTQSALLFLPGFALLLFLLLGYGWEFDNPVIRRLSLPLHIPLVIASGYLLFHAVQNKTFHKVAAFAIGLYYLAYVIPVTNRLHYSKTYTAGLEFKAAEQFLNDYSDQRMLVIADNAGFFILYGCDALSSALANHRLDAIDFFINQPGSPPVYYFQRMVYDPVKMEYRTSGKGRLDESFKLEPIWERHVTEMRKVRVSRITDVEGVEQEAREYETTNEYLKHWGRMLP